MCVPLHNAESAPVIWLEHLCPITLPSDKVESTDECEPANVLRRKELRQECVPDVYIYTFQSSQRTSGDAEVWSREMESRISTNNLVFGDEHKKLNEQTPQTFSHPRSRCDEHERSFGRQDAAWLTTIENDKQCTIAR